MEKAQNSTIKIGKHGVYKRLTEALFFLHLKAAAVVSDQESNPVHIDSVVKRQFAVILSGHRYYVGHGECKKV